MSRTTVRSTQMNNNLIKTSGSSTGTGVEQSISHGLASIPDGARAWIKYLIGARYEIEPVRFDANYIYATVKTGTAFVWRIE